MSRRKRRIAKGLLAGIAGGLVASWTMNEFQALWTKASQAAKPKSEEKPEHGPGEFEADVEDATMKAADRVSRKLLHYPLDKEEKKKAGPLVHYAFGTTVGALYGLSAELAPAVTTGFGTGFGAALFAAADEVAVPALGLSGKPSEAPLSSHVYALASHLVYGAATEGVRRLMLATL